MTKSHVTAAVFKRRAWFLNTVQVRHCWIKIDSAVNLGEKPSSVFMQCVLWVIRLTKIVSWSAVLFTTLWHAESCMTNNTLTTFSSSSRYYDDWCRPSTTIRRSSNDASSPFRRCRLLSCTMQYSNLPAVLRLLLAASYICLVTFLVLYYIIVSFFTIAPLSISLDTVLSHNYCITPVIKVIFWLQSCLLIISLSTETNS